MAPTKAENLNHNGDMHVRWDETLNIDTREVVAVEHPMKVKNVDNGIRTFGLGQPFDRVSLSQPRDTCSTWKLFLSIKSLVCIC